MDYINTHTVLTYDEMLCDYASTYSDLYKDLYGMRPRGQYPSTIQDYKKELDVVSKSLREEMERSRNEKLRKRRNKNRVYKTKPINQPFKVFYQKGK